MLLQANSPGGRRGPGAVCFVFCLCSRCLRKAGAGLACGRGALFTAPRLSFPGTGDKHQIGCYHNTSETPRFHPLFVHGSLFFIFLPPENREYRPGQVSPAGEALSPPIFPGSGPGVPVCSAGVGFFTLVRFIFPRRRAGGAVPSRGRRLALRGPYFFTFPRFRFTPPQAGSAGSLRGPHFLYAEKMGEKTR